MIWIALVLGLPIALFAVCFRAAMFIDFFEDIRRTVEARVRAKQL